MFEAAIGDSPEELRFQQEVSEPSRMDTDIAAFFLVRIAARHGEVALFGCAICRCRRSCGPSVGGLEFLVGVVDEIFFGRHDDCERRGGCAV